MFWCSSLGDVLAFAHSGFLIHGIVSLDTLGTMCHLSLGVWTNTLSVFLFVLFVVLFVFVCIYLFFLYIKQILFYLLLCCWLGITCIVTVDCMSLVCLTCLNIAYHWNPSFWFMCWIRETSLVWFIFHTHTSIGSVRYEIWLLSVFLEIFRFLRCDNENLGFHKKIIKNKKRKRKKS